MTIRKKKKMKKIDYIIVGLGIIAIIAFGYIYFHPHSISLVKGFSNDTTNLNQNTFTVATSTGIGATMGNATVAGNGSFMTLTVLTGSSAATSKVIATTTASFACPNSLIPNFAPANAAATALSGATSIYMASASSTAFIVVSGTSALANTTTYVWNVYAGCI